MRFVSPIFLQIAGRIHSQIAPQFAEAGGFVRPRITIFSPLRSMREFTVLVAENCAAVDEFCGCGNVLREAY
jgi:hypothetical protein